MMEPLEARLAEFDDIVEELDEMIFTFDELAAGRQAAVDVTAGFRRRAADLLGKHLVPLVADMFGIKRLSALQKIVSAVMASDATVLRRRHSGFEFEFRPPAARPNEASPGDNRLASAAVGAFSKAQFPEGITIFRSCPSMTLVQTDWGPLGPGEDID